MPFKGQYALTQPFGPTSFAAEPSYQRYAHFHTGIDYGVPEGTSITAAGPGRVVSAGWTSDGFGNEVTIDHGNGLTTLYGHLEHVSVKPGDLVQAGQPIGLSGTTGNSTGPHLHFGLEKNGVWVDPTPYLSGQIAFPETPTSVPSIASPTQAGMTPNAAIPVYMIPVDPMTRGYGQVTMPSLMSPGIGSTAGTGSVEGTWAVNPSLVSASTSGGVPPSLTPTALNSMIQQVAASTGVSGSLIAAVVQAESAGNPHAVSTVGAKGLMQLMDSTAARYGVTNSFDPIQNLSAGATYLGGLLNQFNGNEQLALAAYNAGPGAVTTYGGIPPYAETQNYVQKVLQLQQRYVPIT
jgi:hypothetical protein